MNEIRFLNHQAHETRAAAAHAPDDWSRQALQQLASHYEKEARRLDADELNGRPGCRADVAPVPDC